MKTIKFILDKNLSGKLKKINIGNDFTMLDAFEIWEETSGIDSIVAPRYLYIIDTNETIPKTVNSIKKMLDSINYEGKIKSATLQMIDRFKKPINIPEIKLEQIKKDANNK